MAEKTNSIRSIDFKIPPSFYNTDLYRNSPEVVIAGFDLMSRLPRKADPARDCETFPVFIRMKKLTDH